MTSDLLRSFAIHGPEDLLGEPFGAFGGLCPKKTSSDTSIFDYPASFLAHFW